MSDLPSAPYAEYWPGVYRFALLMTGSADAASAVVGRTVEQAAERVAQMRDPHQAKRCLFAHARECCVWHHSSPPTPDAPDAAERQLASLFTPLPEEERAALALFYLFLFEPAELAEVLEIKPAALGPLLLRARRSLQRCRLVAEAPPSPALPPGAASAAAA